MNQVLRAVSSSLNTRIHSSYLKQAPVTLKIVCFISNKPIRKKLSKMNPLTKTKIEKYFQPTANAKIKNEIIYEDEVRIKHRNRALEYSNSININIIKEQGKNVYEALIKKFSLRPVSRKTKGILRATRKMQPNIGLSRPNELMLLPPKKTDKEINSRSLLATGNSMVKSEAKISEAIEDRSLRKNKTEQPNATNKEQQNRAKTTNINLYVLSKQKKAFKEDKLKSLNKSRPEIEYHIKKLSEKYNKIRRLSNTLHFKANDAKEMNKNIIVKNQDNNNIQTILQLEKKKRMAMEIMREVRTTNAEENHSTLMSFEQQNRRSTSLSKKKRELQEIIAELKKNKPYKTESKQHSIVMQSIESVDKNNSVRKQELTQNREDKTNSVKKQDLTQNREDKNNSFRKQELPQNREDKNNLFRKQELTQNREDKNNYFRKQELTQNKEDKNNSLRKPELTQNREDKNISFRKQEQTQKREDKNNSFRKQEITQKREDKNNSVGLQELTQNREDKINSFRRQELTQNREDKNNSVRQQELTQNREDKNNSVSHFQKTAPDLRKTMSQDYSNQVDRYRSPNTKLLQTIEKTKAPILNEQKIGKPREQTEVSSQQQPAIVLGGTAVRSANDTESRYSAKYKTEKDTVRIQLPVESEIARNQMPGLFSLVSTPPTALPSQLCTNETDKNLTKQFIDESQSDLNPLPNLKLKTRQELNRSGENMNNSSELQKIDPTLRKDCTKIETDKNIIAGSQSNLNPLLNLKLETRQEFNQSGENMNNYSVFQKTVPTLRKDCANIETDTKFTKQVVAGSQSDLNPLLNLKLETRQEVRNNTVCQQEFNRNWENMNNFSDLKKSGKAVSPVFNNQIDTTAGPEINLMRVKEETKMDVKNTEPKTQNMPPSNEFSNQEHKAPLEEKSIINLTWSEIRLITNTNDKAQIQSASKSIALLTKPSIKSEKLSEQLTKPNISENQVEENPIGYSKLEISEENINSSENKDPMKVEDSPLDTELQIMSNVQQKKTPFKVELTNGGENAIGTTRTNIHHDSNNSTQVNTIIRMDSNPGKYKKKCNSEQGYVSELRERCGSEQETTITKQKKESKAKQLSNEKSKTSIHAVKAQTKNIISRKLSQAHKTTVNDSESGTGSSQEKLSQKQHLMHKKPKSHEKIRNIVKLSLKIPINTCQEQNSILKFKESSKKSTNFIRLLDYEVIKLQQNQLITKTGLLEPVVKLISDVYKNLDRNGQEELSRVCCALREIIVRDNHYLSNEYCKRIILEAQLDLNKKVLLVPVISLELKEILQKLQESKKFKNYFLYPIENNLSNISNVKKNVNRTLNRPYIYPIMNENSLSRTHQIIDSSHKCVISHCQLDKNYVNLNKASKNEIMTLTKSLLMPPKQDETIPTNYSNAKDKKNNTKLERQDTRQNRVQLKTFTKQILNPTLKTKTVPEQKTDTFIKTKDHNNRKLNKALLSTNYSTCKLKNDKVIKNSSRAVNNKNSREHEETVTAAKKLEIANNSESERNVKRKSFRQLTEEAKSSPEFRNKLLDIKIFSQKTEKSVSDIEVIKTSKESKTFQSQCMSYSTMNSSQGYKTDIFSNSTTFREMRFHEVEEVCNSDAILKYVNKFKRTPMFDEAKEPSGYSEMIESIRDSYRNAYLKFRELEKHLLELEQKKIKYVDKEHENKRYANSYNALQDKNFDFSMKSNITLSKSSHFSKNENEDMGAGGDTLEMLPTIKFPNTRRRLDENKYSDIYETKKRSFKELVEQFNKKQRKYNSNKQVNKKQTYVKDKGEKHVDSYSEDGRRDQENVDNITPSQKGIFINKIPIKNKLQKENLTKVGEPLNDFLHYDDQDYDKLNQMNFKIQDEKDYFTNVRTKPKQIGINKVAVLFKMGRSEDEISHEIPRSRLKKIRKPTFQTVTDDQIREVPHKYIKARRSGRQRLLNTRQTMRSLRKIESPKDRDRETREARVSRGPREFLQHLQKEDLRQDNEAISLKKDKPKEHLFTSAVPLPSTLNFHKSILNCKIVQSQEKQEEITVKGNPSTTSSKHKILKSLESRSPPETFAAMALIGPKQPLPTFTNLLYEMKRVPSPDNELDATNRKEITKGNSGEMSGRLNYAKWTKSNHRTNRDMANETTITSQNISNVVQAEGLPQNRGKLKMSDDMEKLKTMMMQKEDNTPPVEIKNNSNTQKQETDKNNGRENTNSPLIPPFIEYLIKSNDLTQTSRVLMGSEPKNHKDGPDTDLSESMHKDLRIEDNYFQKQNTQQRQKLDKNDESENTISLSNAPFIEYSKKSNDLPQIKKLKKYKDGPEPGLSGSKHKDNSDKKTEENDFQKQNKNTQDRQKLELNLDKNNGSDKTISPSNGQFIEYLIKSNDLTQTSRVLMGIEAKKHKDGPESDLSESMHKDNSDLRTEENDFQKQNKNTQHRQKLEIQLDKTSHYKSLDLKKEDFKQDSVSLSKDETKEQLFTSSAVPLPSTLNFHKSILNYKILQCHEKHQESTVKENPTATSTKNKNLKKFLPDQSNIESLQDRHKNNTKYLSEKQRIQTKDEEIKFEEKSPTQRKIKKDPSGEQTLPLKVDEEVAKLVGKVSSLPVETQLNQPQADLHKEEEEYKRMIWRLERYREAEIVSSESKGKTEEAKETQTSGSRGKNNKTEVQEEETHDKNLVNQKELSDPRVPMTNTIPQLPDYPKSFNQQQADLQKEEYYKCMFRRLERCREAELSSSESKGKTEEAQETQSSVSKGENNKNEEQKEESSEKNLAYQKELSDSEASKINTITQLTNNTKSFNHQIADLYNEEEDYKRMLWRLERHREAELVSSESKGKTEEAKETQTSDSKGENNKTEEQKEESHGKNLAHQKELSDQKASMINTTTQSANYPKSFNQQIADLQKEEEDYKRMVWRLERYREAKSLASESKGKKEEEKETQTSGSRGENSKTEVQEEESHKNNHVHQKELSDQRASIINTITQLSNNTNSFNQQPHSLKSVPRMKSDTDVSTNLQVLSPINVNIVNDRTGIGKLVQRNNPRNVTSTITDATPKVAEYLQMDKDHHKKISQPRGENLAYKLTHSEESQSCYELQSKSHYVPVTRKTSNNENTNQNDGDKQSKINVNIKLKHFDENKYKQAVNEMKEQDTVQIQNNIDNTKLDIMKFKISKYRRINKMLEGKTRAEIETTIRQKETKPKVMNNKGNKFEPKPKKPKNNDSLGRLLHHVCTSNTSSTANLALRNLKMKQRESSGIASSESSKNKENNDNQTMISYTKSKNLAIKKSSDLITDVSENTSSTPMKTLNEFLPDEPDGFNFPGKKRTPYVPVKSRKSTTKGRKSSMPPPCGGELNSLMGGVVSSLTRRLQGIPASMSRLLASSHHSRSKPSLAGSKSPPDTKATESNNSWNNSKNTVESLQLKIPKQDKYEEINNVGIIFPKMKYKIRNKHCMGSDFSSSSSHHHIQKEKLNKETRKKRHFSYSDLLNKVYMKHANISQ